MFHMKSEFNMENLLFATVLLELQNYLVTHEYWESMKKVGYIQYSCHSFNHIKLPPNVPISPIISRLYAYDQVYSKTKQDIEIDDIDTCVRIDNHDFSHDQSHDQSSNQTNQG